MVNRISHVLFPSFLIRSTPWVSITYTQSTYHYWKRILRMRHHQKPRAPVQRSFSHWRHISRLIAIFLIDIKLQIWKYFNLYCGKKAISNICCGIRTEKRRKHENNTEEWISKKLRKNNSNLHQFSTAGMNCRQRTGKQDAKWRKKR